MRKSSILIGSIFMVSALLMGCVEAEGIDNIEETQSSKQTLTTEINTSSKEITLFIEDEIKDSSIDSYVFNGFIGEDTLSFETPSGYRNITVLQPAKIGHKFKLKDLDNLEFEIVEFCREKGFVKLSINLINSIQ